MTPYAEARSGHAAREEITKTLQRFGCESVGFMDNFEDKSVTLAFKYRGQPVQLTASGRGWAKLYLNENPWNQKRHLSEKAYEQRWLDQGMIAVNSILRDWVKGQITAVECGILSFGAVFMPYMLTNDGRTLYERADEVNEMLAIEGPK